MENEKWKNIVKRTTEYVINSFDEIVYAVDFGAYIAPEDYFVSYIFKNDTALQNAESTGLSDEINRLHKLKMLENGYPKNSVKDCVFASQEDCDRRFNGNWYYYYK